MNLSELERKLLRAARANPPSDAVPYAFEQRIMARLRDVPAADALADWGRALWRAAAPCAAVALLLGVWSLVPVERAADHADLTQDLEQTVLVAVTQDNDNLW